MNIKKFIGVILASIGFFISLTIWSLASPPGSAPDDDFHLPSIWCSHGKVENVCDPEFKGDGFGKTPTPLSPSAICFAFKSDVSASCQTAMFDWNNKELQGSRTNEKGRFPNGFYWTLHFLIGENTLLSAISMRIFNALLATILLFSTAIISSSKIRVALISSWIAVIVPLSIFTISSTNPSSWSIIGLGTFWAALYSYLNNKNSKINTSIAFALTIISSMIAIQSRSESSFYIIISIILVIFISDHKKLFQPFNKKVFVPVLIFIYSFYEIFTTPSTLGWSTGLPGGDPNRNMQEIWFRNISDWPTFVTGSLGGWPLGWLDVPMPSIVYFFTMVVFISVLFRGIIETDLWKSLSIILIIAVLFFLPLRILALGKNYVGENVQPRYFLPLLFLLVAFSMISAESKPVISFNFPQLILIFVASTISHAFALHFTIRRYITGSDVVDWNLNKNVEWWWDFMPSPMASWILAVIGFSTAVLIGIQQIHKNTKVLN